MKLIPRQLIIATIVFFSPCSPLLSLLFGADLNLNSETIIHSFKRSVDSVEPELILPVFEYLGLDYGNTESGGLSLHLYGWIRKDIIGTDYYPEDPEAELIYGFLQYATPYSPFRVQFGRQHIFAGITNLSIDGLNVETGMGPYFSASVYGGIASSFTPDDSSNTYFTYGGRVAHHYGSAYEVGISYQNTAAESETAQATAGADVFMQFGHQLILNGLSSYNLESQDWREHNFDANLMVGQLVFEPSYQFFQYNDYFNGENQNNAVFAFLKDSDETLTIVGANLLWQPSDLVETGLRGRNYTYDVRDESARYYAGLLTFNLPGGSQLGVEIGRMDGETSDNTYVLYRGFFYWQNPLALFTTGFISGDALYISYDAPVYGEDHSLYSSLGAGHTFFDDQLEIKLSVTYSQDPYFDSDLGGLLTIRLNLNGEK